MLIVDFIHGKCSVRSGPNGCLPREGTMHYHWWKKGWDAVEKYRENRALH